VAEPAYFETLSIPLLRGRTFTEHTDSNLNPFHRAKIKVVNYLIHRVAKSSGGWETGRYEKARIERRGLAWAER
jgi:hypothetical protein